MSALALQPTLLQQAWFNVAEFCWHVNSLATPLLWFMGVVSVAGLAVTWRIRDLDKALLFGAAGTITVAVGFALWLLEAAAVYASGLCL